MEGEEVENRETMIYESFTVISKELFRIIMVMRSYLMC